MNFAYFPSNMKGFQVQSSKSVEEYYLSCQNPCHRRKAFTYLTFYARIENQIRILLFTHFVHPTQL